MSESRITGRSTKAGAETPATPWSSVLRVSSLVKRTLNEGRGRDPGDTSLPIRCKHHAQVSDRSTKAGAETPATHAQRPSAQFMVMLHRSTKAGAETPATRPCDASRAYSSSSSLNEGPGPRPRRHVKRLPNRRPVRLRTLNEGRGRDPGDTRQVVYGRPVCRLESAQRRPGPRPRRHPCWRALASSEQGALNEGRGRDPGDTANRRGTPSWTQLGTRSADA